jgi:hypothetical protein
MTIRERVKIKPGGMIEISDPSLPAGEEAEVTVVVERRAATDAPAGGDASSKPLWQRIVEIGAAVPEGDWDKVPVDLSKNLDHYLYGAPKEEE